MGRIWLEILQGGLLWYAEGQDAEMREERTEGTSGARESSGGVTFGSLVLMFGTTALVHLGAAPDPVSGEQKADLEQAKHAIDLLDVLKEKTSGNLTTEESSLLENLLFDLRLRYVEAVKGR
jgi:hypothetical protein